MKSMAVWLKALLIGLLAMIASLAARGNLLLPVQCGTGDTHFHLLRLRGPQRTLQTGFFRDDRHQLRRSRPLLLHRLGSKNPFGNRDVTLYRQTE